MKATYPRVSTTILLVISLIATPYIISAQTGMGVGTNTPAEKLDVNGAVKIGNTSTTNAGTIRWTGTDFEGYDGSQWITFGGGNAGWSLTGNTGTTPGTNFLGTTDNQALHLRTNNTDRLTILSGGGVGIGTTNPAGSLQIYKTTSVLRITDSDDNSTIALVAPGGSYSGGIGTLTNHDLPFFTNNADRMMITSGGNVGIGSTSPTEKLDVNGRIKATNPGTSPNGSSILLMSPSNDLGITMNRGDGSGSVQQRWDMKITNNNNLNLTSQITNDYFSFTNAGNMGIGTTTPQEKVHVSGGNLLLDRGGSGNVTRSIILQGAAPLGHHYFGELMFKGFDNTSGSFEYEGAAIKARNLGSDNNGALSFWTRDTSLVEWMTLNKNGVLQINPNGITGGNPGLSIDGSFKLENGSQAAGYVLQSDASGGATWVDPTTISDGDWTISGNNQYSAVSGNVGIGANNPSEMLHLRRDGSDNYIRIDAATSNSGYAGIRFAEPALNYGWFMRFDASPAGGLHFDFNGGTNTSERVTILPSGNVGIGTTNPADELEVQGSIRMVDGNQANGYIPVSNANGAMTWTDPSTISTAGANEWLENGTHIYNGNSGNVGIGTSNPESELNIKVSNNGLNTPLTLRNGNDNQSGGNAVGIAFANQNGTAAPKAMIVNERTTGWGKGSLHFLLNDDNNANGATLSDARMTITRQGNVGIGTTNPNDELEVQGSIRMVDGNQASGYIPVSNANGTMTWTDPTTIATADDGDWVENGNHIYNGNSGNVGVGTSSPNFELHVHDNTADNAWLQFTQASTGTSSSTDGLLIGIDNSEQAVFQNRENTDMLFQTNSTEQVRITAAGNVGIGTSTPESLLNLKVSNNGLNTPLTLRNGNDTQSGGNAVGIAFSNNNGAVAPKAMIVNERTASWGKGSLHFLSNNDNNASAATLADARMTITSNGNVGIGTTAPSSALHVATNSANGPTATIETGSNAYPSSLKILPSTHATSERATIEVGSWGLLQDITGGGTEDFAIYNNNTNTQSLAISATDNVGIGTRSPADKLEVNGGHIRMVDGNQQAGYIPVSDANGTMTWTDPTTIATADDGDWTVNGSDMYNANSGKVGVGTNTPDWRFSVSDNESTAGFGVITDGDGIDLIWKNYGGVKDLDFRFQNNAGTIDTTLMTIKGNGGYNVGIGELNPDEKLHVAGNIRMVDGNQAVGFIPVSDANGTMTWTDPTTIATADDGDWTVNGSDMYNGNTGNVGVGVNTPAEKLHVSNGDVLFDRDTNNSNTARTLTIAGKLGGDVYPYASIDFRNYDDNDGNADYVGASIRSHNEGSSDDGDLRFYTTSDQTLTEAVRIRRNGNVGIGTTVPSSALHVAANSASGPTAIIETGSNAYPSSLKILPSTHATSERATIEVGSWGLLQDITGGGTADFAIYNNNTSTQSLAISANDNVGIGTRSPADKLEVKGGHIRMVDGNQASGYIPVSDANGTMTWTDPTTIATDTLSIIADADRDTKIQVEESADEDKIRFDVAGMEVMVINDTDEGMVGIGTDNPRSELHISDGSSSLKTVNDAGGYGASMLITDNNIPRVYFEAASQGADKKLMDISYLNQVLSIGSLTDGGGSWDKQYILAAHRDGNVGVGTSSPSEALHIKRNGSDNYLRIDAASTGSGYAGIRLAEPSFDYGWFMRFDAGSSGALSFAFNDNTPSTTDRMTILPAGNVGIGSTNPTEKLEVMGTIKATNPGTSPDGSSILLQSPANDLGITMNRGDGSGSVQQRWDMKVTNDNALRLRSQNTADLFSFTNAGNMGIGTTTPSDELHVEGSVRMVDGNQTAGYIPVSDVNGTMTWTDPTTIATADDGDWTVNGNDQYSSVSGNVGVGTTTPAAVLNVYEPDENSAQANFTQALDNAGLLVTSQYTNGTYTPGIFWNTSNDNSDKPKAGIYTQNTNTGSKLLFGTSNLYSSGITNTGLALSETGNVGVGTTSPADELEVQGSIRMVDGNQQNGYVAVSDANGTMSWADPSTLSDGDWSTNGNHIYNANSGNVGIGTTSPSHEMQIHDASSPNSWLQFTQSATGSSSNDGFVIGVNNAEEVHLNQKENNDMVFKTNNNEKMRIMASGNVGIGTSNPTNALLEVDGSVGSHSLSGIGYLNTGGSGTGNYNGGFSIYASNRISGFAFIAHSDERIKDIKGVSNSTDDLETLKKIQITDYQYIDKVGKGDGMQKKLIAQQVEDVYPQAVETNITEVVPDIYQLANINGGWVNLSTDLKVGDMVQLILDNSNELVEVKEVNESGFRVELDAEGDVFVFGRQVDDFHTVDYEAISMLNVSATQELAKKLEASEAKNVELEEKLKSLEAQLMKEKTDNQARLERLEAELGIGLSTQK